MPLPPPLPLLRGSAVCNGSDKEPMSCPYLTRLSRERDLLRSLRLSCRSLLRDLQATPTAQQQMCYFQEFVFDVRQGKQLGAICRLEGAPCNWCHACLLTLLLARRGWQASRSSGLIQRGVCQVRVLLVG